MASSRLLVIGRRLLIGILALGPWAMPPARAVLIQAANSTDNTTPPTDDPGWAAVGVRGIGNGVYLGDRLVLTVAHGGPVGIVLDGTTWGCAAA